MLNFRNVENTGGGFLSCCVEEHLLVTNTVYTKDIVHVCTTSADVRVETSGIITMKTEGKSDYLQYLTGT